MKKERVALCEAEDGTGKTHAYLIAAVVYRLLHAAVEPVMISASAFALQKELAEEYIPQISKILLEHHVIGKPLTFVIRKEKNHYACDSRVRAYLLSVRRNNRPEDQELIEILTALFAGACSIDLDDLPLTRHVKERIRVEQCPDTCEFFDVCCYHAFLRRLDQGSVDFQITNHNLMLADVLSGKNGHNHLFPEYSILILDEAYKLPDAARQIYGLSFESMEMERLTSGIYQTAVNRTEKESGYQALQRAAAAERSFL